MARMSWRKRVLFVSEVVAVLCGGTLILSYFIVEIRTPEQRAHGLLQHLRYQIGEFYARHGRLPSSLDELHLEPRLLLDATGRTVGYSADPDSGRVRLSAYYRHDGEEREMVLDFTVGEDGSGNSPAEPANSGTGM